MIQVFKLLRINNPHHSSSQICQHIHDTQAIKQDHKNRFEVTLLEEVKVYRMNQKTGNNQY